MRAEDFEKELGIKFNGPGMYLSKTDTVLVVPIHRTYAEQWHQKYNEDELFHVSVFNLAFEHTIYATIALAPSRLDTRL